MRDGDDTSSSFWHLVCVELKIKRAAMRWTKSVLLAGIALVGCVQAASSTSSDRCFPDSFMLGSATASYQVEGAVNETGRTSSIWDDFCRERNLQCANVADDFFHRYKDDIKTMEEAGLESFRFSISWSRVMNWNTNTKRMVRNQPGIEFYHALIDEVRVHGLVPILTLYHWDLPSELHTQLSPPGWLNTEISSHYVEYAELMFKEFGSKVDFWTTFNEPWTFTSNGYGSGAHAPGMSNSDTNAYTAGHNLLLSHAKAVAKFRSFKNTNVIRSSARITIVLVTHFSYPLNATDARDIAAAERRTEFMFGWYLKPIVTGDYPPVMRERAGDRLPRFTSEESALLKGSYDLFMMNYYSSHLVTDCSSPNSAVKCSALSPGWERDLGIDDSHIPEGARRNSKNKAGALNCVKSSAYAPGYLETMKWMHKHDQSAEILLTENGWCGNEEIESQDQLWYFQTHLDQVHKAVVEEKIPVIGYTAWSLLDNYEWGSFGPRFGLYYVDMPENIGDKDFYAPNATQLTRIPRLAGRWFSKLAKSKCLTEGEAQFTVSLSSDVEAPLATRVSIVLAPFMMLIVIAIIAAIARKRRALSTSTNEHSPLLTTKSN